MIALAMTARGRSAVPAKTSPSRKVFPKVAMMPIRAISMVTCIACRRRFGFRAITAPTSNSTPSPLGISAVKLAAPEAT